MPLISFVRATLAIILFALALPSAAQIVIGQIAAFSGPLAPTGTHMRAGAQLYTKGGHKIPCYFSITACL